MDTLRSTYALVVGGTGTNSEGINRSVSKTFMELEYR